MFRITVRAGYGRRYPMAGSRVAFRWPLHPTLTHRLFVAITAPAQTQIDSFRHSVLRLPCAAPSSALSCRGCTVSAARGHWGRRSIMPASFHGRQAEGRFEKQYCSMVDSGLASRGRCSAVVAFRSPWASRCVCKEAVSGLRSRPAGRTHQRTPANVQLYPSRVAGRK